MLWEEILNFMEYARWWATGTVFSQSGEKSTKGESCYNCVFEKNDE